MLRLLEATKDFTLKIQLLLLCRVDKNYSTVSYHTILCKPPQYIKRLASQRTPRVLYCIIPYHINHVRRTHSRTSKPSKSVSAHLRLAMDEVVSHFIRDMSYLLVWHLFTKISQQPFLSSTTCVSRLSTGFRKE